MKQELDFKKGAPPLYAQLEKILRKSIEEGEFVKGDMFPSEKELMEKYGVSRMTVREAAGKLARDGYILGARGIGTRVTYEKIDDRMSKVTSLTDEMRKQGKVLETTFCEITKKPAPAKIALEFSVTPDTECYCLTRVRAVDKRPLVYTETWLKTKESLSPNPAYYMDSLYRYLNKTYGIILTKGVDTLEAVLPDDTVTGFLKINDTEPVFKRTRRTYQSGSGIFEFTYCYYPGSRYRYTVEY